jgi:UPF0755 protein
MSLDDVVPAPSPGNPRRSSRRAAEKRRKNRRRRTVVIALIGVLVLSGAAAGAWLGLKPLLDSVGAADDYTGSGSGEVLIRIPDGASGTQIGQVLEKAGVVKSSSAFVSAFSENPAAPSIQAGSYTLRRQMSAASALASLLDPATKVVSRVTVPEGKRVPQVLDILVKASKIPRADFEAALKRPADIGLPASVKSAEGYLFASTYDLAPEATAEQLLSEMVDRTFQELQELEVPEARRNTVLTLASIVQAESGNERDMGKVARVFTNRLAGLTGTRLLQSDATVSYATNSFDITTTDAQRASPSRYNTYRWPGLPPGPIGAPGVAAIKAALDPTPGKWLYFVTVDPDTGETRFANTFAEHQKNEALFLAWLKANPGRR